MDAGFYIDVSVHSSAFNALLVMHVNWIVVYRGMFCES